MEGIAFQKMDLPNGKTYTVTRSGIGDPAIEYVVNETSYRGNVFHKYGTYDECMDFISELATTCTPIEAVERSNIAEAIRDAANENFHRELG